MIPLSLAALSLGTAHAQDPTMAPELGAGGTSRASLASMTAVVTAPALIALRPRYDVAFGARLGPDEERLYQGAALDSITSPVSLGLVYLHQTGSPPTSDEDLPGWQKPGQTTSNPTTATTIGGALAAGLADNQVGLGLGVLYRRHSSRFTDLEQSANMSLSIAATAADQLTVSVTGENLLPIEFPGAPTQLGGGLSWQPADLAALMGDVVTDFDSLEQVTVSWGVGCRIGAFRPVPIRFGFQRDAVLDLDALTAGIGMGDEVWSLDYGFRMPVGQDANAFHGLGTWHSLSLRFSR